MPDNVILYGSPLSLYTGKVRSYFIKNTIAYTEIAPTNQHYAKTVLPAASAQTMPTIETEDKTVIRDGTAIIDHYEKTNNFSASPNTAKQKIISRLFDVVGSEGLLRPAMHYRWHYQENLPFITPHFRQMIPPVANRDELTEKTMNKMRGACVAFGANDDNKKIVEEVYLEFLNLLNKHFEQQPYLLGGKPCIGDFGLIAPMYAHLGRDPKPLSIMQNQAVAAYRWVERMNRPEADCGEFDSNSNEFLAGDQIPDTLIALLKHIAEDFVPETLAAAKCINDWLDAQPTLAANTAIERGVGFGEFGLRGNKIIALAQPYRFYLLKRMQDDYAQLTEQDQQEVKSLLNECGLSELLTTTINRDITRRNNLEVWC